MLSRALSAVALCMVVVSSAAADGFIETLQPDVVRVYDKQWFVKIRVAQDKPDRPEAGLSGRMASTIAMRKLLEFACDMKPAAGEKLTGSMRGLLTVSSNSNAEWAEVVLSAPVQKVHCKTGNAEPVKKAESSIRVFPLD